MSSDRPRAWLLNLDVEEELIDPGGYTPSAAMVQRLREAPTRLAALLGEQDMVVDPVNTSRSARGFVAAAWCPTPRALAHLQACGAERQAAPTLEVLRRVNDRAFAIALDPGPLGSVYLQSLDQVRGALVGEGPWLLKRGLSFAGRGHRRILGPLSDEDLRWCDKTFRRGVGLALEPLVERAGDFAQHGYLSPTGELALGAPTRQVCDARGTWQSSQVDQPGSEGALSPSERDHLHAAALKAGRALAAADYFGPFGIDAFRFRRDGKVEFNPMVELNARYSMGWPASACVELDASPNTD